MRASRFLVRPAVAVAARCLQRAGTTIAGAGCIEGVAAAIGRLRLHGAPVAASHLRQRSQGGRVAPLVVRALCTLGTKSDQPSCREPLQPPARRAAGVPNKRMAAEAESHQAAARNEHEVAVASRLRRATDRVGFPAARKDAGVKRCGSRYCADRLLLCGADGEFLAVRVRTHFKGDDLLLTVLST